MIHSAGKWILSRLHGAVLLCIAESTVLQSRASLAACHISLPSIVVLAVCCVTAVAASKRWIGSDITSFVNLSVFYIQFVVVFLRHC